MVARPLRDGHRADRGRRPRRRRARALDYLWTRQQQPDGCFPQNSNLDGSPHWASLQLDEVADPILLAWQLGRTDAGTWSHVERAAECILAKGPVTQERWENADGYSPASIGAEIAGLVCAAQIAQRNGASGRRRAATARSPTTGAQRLDHWTRDHQRTAVGRRRTSCDSAWTATPTRGTTYTIADGGPTVDQRTVVDPSFLELVRLGVLRADDPDVRHTLPVVDRELGVDTPNGQFWHRFNHDGYGETPGRRPFGTNDGNRAPVADLRRRARRVRARRGQLAGTRGRPRGRDDTPDAIANTANDGLMLPEQVWDDNPPAGTDGARPGTGTVSATPLGLDARPVRPARLVDRRRAPGGAPAASSAAATRWRLSLS